MKKLMVAAVAAMIGVAANAAAVEWAAYPIYDMGAATENTGYCAYYFDAGYSTESIITALGAGDLDFLSSGYEADALTDGGFTGGVSGDVYGKSESVSGYLVIFNASTAADATYAYISGTAGGATGDEGQSASVSFEDAQLSGMQTAGNWTQVAPEPTSGLLLLIGVAGLALRRRRA